MTFSYSESGTITLQDGTQISAIVDTESPAFLARVAWLKAQTGLGCVVTISISQSPGDLTPNIVGSVVFEREGDCVPVDAFLLMRSPEVALVGLDTAFNLRIANVGAIKFSDEPPAAVPDWQTPGAPIGQPWPTRSDVFTFRGTGQPDGYIWTGPSGARYQVVRIGAGMFAQPAWQKL